MSDKICLIYSLTAEDFKRVHAFLHRDDQLNVLQRLVIFILNKSMDRKGRKRETEQKETKYEFDENGVRLSYSHEVDSVPWNYFTEIVEYDDGYFFISENRQIQIVVPKRVLKNRSVEASFKNLVRLKLGSKAKLQLLQ